MRKGRNQVFAVVPRLASRCPPRRPPITRRPANGPARPRPRSGMDAAKLNEAMEFMKAHETASPARDFSDQEIVNGKLLASMPTERGRHERPHHPPRLHRRGVRRHAASRSDLQRREEHARHGRGHRPRSRADSELDSPVANVVKDGGYDSPQNSRVTWRHHLQQESEWEGEMWGKNANFIGREAFGARRDEAARDSTAGQRSTNTTTCA